MMRQRIARLGAACGLVLVLALPALADGVEDSVVADLRQQGYTGITTSHTWLGRLRVVAMQDGARREIVINPYTGEILRDYQAPALRMAGGEGSRRDSAIGATTAGGLVSSEALGDTQTRASGE